MRRAFLPRSRRCRLQRRSSSPGEIASFIGRGTAIAIHLVYEILSLIEQSAIRENAVSWRNFPPGSAEDRVRPVLARCEDQAEIEPFARIEAAREAEVSLRWRCARGWSRKPERCLPACRATEDKRRRRTHIRVLDRRPTCRPITLVLKIRSRRQTAASAVPGGLTGVPRDQGIARIRPGSGRG